MAPRRRGRARPDAHLSAAAREAADRTAVQRYRYLLQMRDDPEFMLSEQVAELREKALARVTVPVLCPSECAAAMKSHQEENTRIKDQRKRTLKRLRTGQTRKLEGESPSARFEKLMVECNQFISPDTETPPSSPSTGRRKAASPLRTPKRGSQNDRDGDDEQLEVDAKKRMEGTPAYLAGALRSYQVDGVNWLLQRHDARLPGILADEMGLGKTFQTIAFLSFLRFSKNLPGPHLVIAPRSVLGNWAREVARWSPGLTVLVFHGVGPQKVYLGQKMTPEKLTEDVVLTTWEMVNTMNSRLRRIKWQYIIVDEAHRIKNENSLTARMLARVGCVNKMLLTGTPLQNNLRELWALLNYLMTDLFNDADEFDSWFSAGQGREEQSVIHRLHTLLKPFMLRRVKDEVEKALPKKKEVYVACPFSKQQRETYKLVLARDLKTVNMRTGVPQKAKLANILMQLRKACNHPFLFDGADDSPGTTSETIVSSCGKMVILDKLLTKLFSVPEAKREKVLVFSQMTRMLDILEDYLNLRGYKFCRIDGNTVGHQRDSQMNEFNSVDTEKQVFLLSTRAGGLGINLQAASVVVLYDSDWNPQADLQAMDRAHRIGQTRPVTVYRMITEPSVEERIYERALRKLYLDAVIVQQGNLRQRNQQVSGEELLGMIRFGAGAVFRNAKDVNPEDVDIDALLDQGARTISEMQQRLEKDQQRSLRNFQLGVADSNYYEFEGVDYGEKPTKMVFIEGLTDSVGEEAVTAACRKYGQPKRVVLSPHGDRCMVEFGDLKVASAARNGLQGGKVAGVGPVKAVFGQRGSLVEQDLVQETLRDWQGERERRRAAIAAFEARLDAMDERQSERKEPQVRLPRMPRFLPHQFYDVERIEELHEKECEFLIKAHDDKKKGLPGPAEGENGLTRAERREREMLMAAGFADWRVGNLRAFCAASGRHGRDNIAAIAQDIGKPVEEVERYHHVFWERGRYELTAFAQMEERIAKREAVLQVKNRTRDAMLWKYGKASPAISANPWQTTCAPPKSSWLPAAPADRLLLAYTMQEGYGNWAAVLRQLRRSPELQFDFYALSRTPADIARRVAKLVLPWRKEFEATLAQQDSAIINLRSHAAAAAADAETPALGDSKSRKRVRKNGDGEPAAKRRAVGGSGDD